MSKQNVNNAPLKKVKSKNKNGYENIVYHDIVNELNIV